MGFVEAVQALLSLPGLRPKAGERTRHGAIVVSQRALQAMHRADKLTEVDDKITTFSVSVPSGPKLVDNPGGDNRFDPEIDPPGLRARYGGRYKG